MNIRISDEAQAFTRAPKEKSRTKGNWGEMILESILGKSGLVKDREYFKHTPLVSEEGKRLQPDFFVKYPGDRTIVIDAKVPLTAYERYCDTDESAEKDSWLKAHLLSVKNHIDKLAGKTIRIFIRSARLIL